MENIDKIVLLLTLIAGILTVLREMSKVISAISDGLARHSDVVDKILICWRQDMPVIIATMQAVRDEIRKASTQ